MSRTISSTSHLDSPSSSVYNNLNAITLATWVFVPLSGSFTGWVPLIVKAAQGVYKPFLTLLNAAPQGIGRDSGFTEAVQQAGAIWQHVAMTWNRSTDDKVHLYLNGTECTYSAQPVGGALVDDSAFGFRLGTDGGGNVLLGSLFDVRVYNKALSSLEVASVAQGGVPSFTNLVAWWKLLATAPFADSSGNGNTLVDVGGTTNGPADPLVLPDPTPDGNNYLGTIVEIGIAPAGCPNPFIGTVKVIGSAPAGTSAPYLGRVVVAAPPPGAKNPSLGDVVVISSAPAGEPDPFLGSVVNT